MVTSGYQFMNLQFVHLLKNMPTEHQLLVKVLAYRKYCRRQFKYPSWTSQGNNICITELCNHPEKGGQMNKKQSASPCTCILVTFILKWEKKTSLHLEIISFIYPKNPKKYETRWKWNLAFNNDDGKKTIQKTIYKLFTKIIYIKKINKKFNYYPPPSAFSGSMSLSENRNKIIQKMYYPWIHYMVQNWCNLNKIALQ